MWGRKEVKPWKWEHRMLKQRMLKHNHILKCMYVCMYVCMTSTRYIWARSVLEMYLRSHRQSAMKTMVGLTNQLIFPERSATCQPRHHEQILLPLLFYYLFFFILIYINILINSYIQLFIYLAIRQFILYIFSVLYPSSPTWKIQNEKDSLIIWMIIDNCKHWVHTKSAFDIRSV